MVTKILRYAKYFTVIEIADSPALLSSTSSFYKFDMLVIWPWLYWITTFLQINVWISAISFHGYADISFEETSDVSIVYLIVAHNLCWISNSLCVKMIFSVSLACVVTAGSWILYVYRWFSVSLACVVTAKSRILYVYRWFSFSVSLACVVSAYGCQL